MKVKFVMQGLLCALLTMVSVSANADPVLSPTDPAVINRENKIQLRDSFIEEKIIQPVEDKTRLKDILDRQQKNQEDEKMFSDPNLIENPQFRLNKLYFRGNTKVSSAKLEKLAADLIGKDVYIEDIMDLTVKISRYYQKKGYLTSYAYLPEQEIEDGNVVIIIKESKVVSKEVEGNRWERDWFFKNVAMYSSGLREGNVFNARDLQGAMKHINDSSYMKAGASITKDENHDTEIKLHVKDRFPISLDFAWDDYGRNYTGRQRFTSLLGFDNFLGFGDKLYGGAILSSRSNGALAGYQIPISKYGTKLAFDYSFSNVRLGGPYQSLGIKGQAETYSIKLIQPIKNTATQDISAYISFDAINSKSKSTLFRENLSAYRLRVLRTGINSMFDDSKGRTIANLGVDLGTNALGASPNIQGAQRSSFYKVVASLARVQRLPKKCLAIFRINGQYSPQALYSAEQMFLGGTYSIRGYQPSELLGDYGVAGSLELRSPIPGFEKILPNKIKHWSDNVKLAAFYDWGYVRDHKDLYGYPSNFLHSVGVGANINITRDIYIQFGWGLPLGYKYYGEHDQRFYFSVNTDIDRILMRPRERL